MTTLIKVTYLLLQEIKAWWHNLIKDKKKNVTSRQRVYVTTDCYKGFTASLIMQAVLISR